MLPSLSQVRGKVRLQSSLLIFAIRLLKSQDLFQFKALYLKVRLARLLEAEFRGMGCDWFSTSFLPILSCYDDEGVRKVRVSEGNSLLIGSILAIASSPFLPSCWQMPYLGLTSEYW